MCGSLKVGKHMGNRVLAKILGRRLGIPDAVQPCEGDTFLRHFMDGSPWQSDLGDLLGVQRISDVCEASSGKLCVHGAEDHWWLSWESQSLCT